MLDYDTKTGEFWAYDEITRAGLGGVDAGSVKEFLGKMGKKDVTIRLNSPGGDLNEGICIFNLLERHRGTVTTVNDSLAASIASFIFMAGDIRLAAGNSLTMIHSPWTLAMGNAEDLRKTADLLDKASSTIEPVYAQALGIENAQLREMLEEETWMTADEAVGSGLATAVGHDPKNVEPVQVAASMFKNTPSHLILNAEPGSKHPFYRKRQKYDQLIRRTAAKYKVDPSQ